MKKWTLQSKEAYQSDRFKSGAKKFYNVNGTLKPYAFACGYREHYRLKKAEIKLWQNSIIYIVDKSAPDYHEREVFGTLTEARAAVKRAKVSMAGMV